jgi:hypothetical protein
MRRIDEPDDVSPVRIEHPVRDDDHRAGSGEGGWAQRAQGCGALGLDPGDTPETQRLGGCLGLLE